MKKITFAICLSFLLSVSTSAAREIASFGKVPHFQFKDQHGKNISLESLKGHVWIADFIFTRCQEICPMMTGRMKLLEAELVNPKLRFVSFSVDPEHDRPETLLEYMKAKGISSKRWSFLTGPKNDIWNLAIEGFHLAVQGASVEDLNAGASPILHSGYFVLVDQEGAIREFYDSEEPRKIQALKETAEKLVKSDES